MGNHTNRDTRLIQEAYAVQLLRETAQSLTLEQLTEMFPNMSYSELEYINTVQDRIITEFWGGMKNVFGTAKQSAINTGGAIKNAAVAGGKAAANVGRGVAAAGQQMGQNVKDMWQTGEAESEAAKLATKAKDSAETLVNWYKKLQQMGILKDNKKNPYTLSLSNIIKSFDMALDTASQNKAGSRQKGFTGGAKQAFQGARNPSAPAGADVTA
jgi:hypothetical protein